ncbi:hypothetical protein FRC12_022715, partial [Ceratobasidium sp. 428]
MISGSFRTMYQAAERAVILPTLSTFSENPKGNVSQSSEASFSSQYRTSKLALADNLDIHITKLLVHPIKSCRGISIPESRYTPQGLQFDRQYLIIEADTHKCITARQISKMVLIETAIELGETPLLR